MAGDLSVDGVDDWSAALDARLTTVRSATGDGVNAGLRAVQAQAQANLSRKSHPPRTVTPSAPGEPPALISGAMARSFVAQRTRRGPDIHEGRLAPTAVQSRIQELGGMTGAGHRTRLPPRPYFAPAIRDAAPKVRRIFVGLWARALRG